jgi:ubiquinone/menaquinone biosynthesis C-methylase UbiE/uncharacterized protein YbaR (Trm112 family)
MKRFLSDFLICPACLPEEVSLNLQIYEIEDNDVLYGVLSCKKCGVIYKIEEGVGILTSDFPYKQASNSKYENPRVVSSYLWSHYGDLMNDPEWLSSYLEWTRLMEKTSGFSLDIGCAVGRFTFEMTEKCDFSIGFDLSLSFIKTARDLMKKGALIVELTEEGEITSSVLIELPENINRQKVEFIVADALNIPFPKGFFTQVASLNIIDKVPSPMRHLKEMNRVSSDKFAQLLISDPFSWNEDVASIKEWLGGKKDGEFSGFAHDNVGKILKGFGNHIIPPWKIERKGAINWKIRNHRNHSEFIKSLYIKAERE